MAPPQSEQILSLLMDVRERVVAVETKVDSLKDAQTTASTALEKAEDACEDIEEIKGSLMWTHRSVVGLVLAALFNVFFAPFG